MRPYVRTFDEIDRTSRMAVGGKGANLAELAKMAEIRVPDGFCISTEAYKRMIEEASMSDLLDQLSLLTVQDREKIHELSRRIRIRLEGVSIPEEIREEICFQLSEFGANQAFAIRSSATAEDLPTASFAGQLDTYLNIIGREAVLKHISKCWASLFSERAIVYRIQNGFDHRKVYLSVVVQKMVFPQASGMMFTADPVTSNRKVVSIDAGFGLGEALVSGLVNTDTYKVRDGVLIDKKISTKKMAIYPLKGGGTKERAIRPDRQNQQVLTDQQISNLTRIGRMIEKRFVCPQDIEWCLADGTVYILQTRPITTLFPIPDANDQELHVYISVGHQQMMTDPIKPLGLSFFLLTTNAPMCTAGGRLFVDVTQQLASPVSREILLNVMGQHDPLMKDALSTLMERGGFVQAAPDHQKGPDLGKNHKVPSPAGFRNQIEDDPTIVSDLIRRSRRSLEVLKEKIQMKSGSDLLDFILDDIGQLKKMLSDPRSTAVFMAAMDASAWINEHMNRWLGEKNVADTLSQSVPNNVTSEMGLALLDVADAIRPYPEVVRFLRQVKDDSFLDQLVQLEGGVQARDAIQDFLDRYGMRCPGEIDITRSRWSEKPATLLPLILSNIRNFKPNESQRKFERGRREALKKAEELLERVAQLPGGEEKAKETQRMIRLMRNFIGYRE